MALNKYKIGSFVTIVDEKNTKNLSLPFYGININKEFMPTMASTEGLDGSKYKIMRKGRFVFSGMQTGRDMCLRIGLYDLDFDSLISPAYTTFEITNSAILPEYFFMLFLSKEMDRRCAFMTDSSVRSNLDWDVFCNIEIELPSIEIQQKYVNVYKAMVANQNVYENGLDDLKLVCDAYIENLRRKYPCEEIGKYIECTDRKNTNCNLEIRGISNKQKLIPSESRTIGVNKEKYLQIDAREFGYSPIHINDGSIAFNDSTNSFLLSPIYKTFKVKDENNLYPEYLMLWFARNEFIRYCKFYAFGSARDTFDWKEMCEVLIPIPDISVQKAIAKIYKVYCTRKEINEKLKTQIKNMCPILIQGALQEGRKEES